jgi:hypothetical protein
MDELIGRLVANVGVDRAAAEKAIGIILQFLHTEGPPDKVRELIDRVPGAGDALDTATSESTGDGGIMGAGTRMMAAGLSVTEIQAVTREVLGFAGEKVGDEAVGEIVGGIPGLGHFM